MKARLYRFAGFGMRVAVAGGIFDSACLAAEHPWIWRSGLPHGGEIPFLAASPAMVLAYEPEENFLSSSPDGVHFRILPHVSPERLAGPFVWSGSLWVSPGREKGILTSPDGLVWTRRHVASVRQIASNSSGLVAVGADGILHSADALTWTRVASYPDVYAVTWTGTQWMAGSSGGLILTSPNGSNWVSSNPGIGSAGKLVSNGTETLAVCRFPNVWQWHVARYTTAGGWAAPASAHPDIGAYGESMDLLWTGTHWLSTVSGAGRRNISGDLRTSPDGITWTAASPSPEYTLCRFGNTILSGGENGVSRVTIAASGEATVIPLSRAHPGELTCVVWTGMRLVAGGQESNGQDGLVIVSDDEGNTWRKVSTPALFGGSIVNEMVWTGTKLVAVGSRNIQYGSPLGWTSRDGLTWEPFNTQLSRGPVNGVGWSGSSLGMVNEDGEVSIIERDGTNRYFSLGETTTDIDWNGAAWVVSGESLVHTSEDGISWRTSLPDSSYSSALWERVLPVGGFAIVPHFQGSATVDEADPTAIWRHRYANSTGLAGHGEAWMRTTSTISWWFSRTSSTPLVGRLDHGSAGHADDNTSAGYRVSQPLNDLVWTGRQFVAVGRGGAILTSGEPEAPAVNFENGNVTLRWKRFSNYDEYTVESSSDLSVWTGAGPPVVGREEWSAPESSLGQRRFFRIAASPKYQ